MAKFNYALAVPTAWELCWRDNVQRRANGGDFRGNTYYLTASDIEMQVRRFAKEQLAGKPWGSTGRAWGRDTYSGVWLEGDVQVVVRDWLLRNPRLQRHNFGRGHVSGMRFRPVGEPLAPAEERTLNKQAQPKPVHLRAKDDKPVCQWGKPPRKRSMFSSHRRRTWPRMTENTEEVTCTHCLAWLRRDNEMAPF